MSGKTAEELLDTDWWRESDADLLDSLRELESVSRKLYAAILGAVYQVNDRGLSTIKGYPHAHGLLRDTVRITTKEAELRVKHADAVSKSTALTEATRAGVLGADHVDAIVRTLDSLPDFVDVDDRVEAENILITAAQELDANAVKKLGRDIVARLDQDGREPVDESYAQSTNELHYTVDPKGRVRFRGELEPESGAVFTALLSPLAKPRPVDGQPDTRSAGERQGDAFAELVQLTANAAAVPVEGGERPHLVVTVPLETLQDGIGTASLGDAGTLNASQIRRIACDATIIPTVLGGNSEPLDIGRSTRTIPTAIRRALTLRDRGCTFPTCDRRPQWTEAHHVTHWAQGGPTNLANLALLCRVHHTLIHHSDWELRIREGLPEFIPPAYIDPDQVPRRNMLHRARSPLRRKCLSG